LVDHETSLTGLHALQVVLKMLIGEILKKLNQGSCVEIEDLESDWLIQDMAIKLTNGKCLF
jgi:hypothetical protein